MNQIARYQFQRRVAYAGWLFACLVFLAFFIGPFLWIIFTSLVLYLIFQRYLTEGISATGVKG